MFCFTARADRLPVVERVSMVAPDVIAVTIQAGRVVPSRLEKYQPREDDARKEEKDQFGRLAKVTLLRGGKEVGWLIGPQRDHVVWFEKLEGEPLRTERADWAGGFRVRSTEDAVFSDGVAPTAVWRKSKPTDWTQPTREFAMQHKLYWKLPQPLQTGREYELDLTGLNVRESRARFRWDWRAVRSEAVHVNQIGFRPDDPVKRAFLSVWLGTGGAHRYPEGLRFEVIDEKSGQTVFEGIAELAKSAEQKERMQRDENFNKTNVYRLDFNDFSRAGRYRVAVEGVGCSYPFEIGREVWTRAFAIQMKGLYNQRSGVELGPPHTEFRKPRDFHPAGDVPIFYSEYSRLDGPTESPELERRSTGKAAPDAWGGYRDAGDWNPRRVSHMRVTAAHLELLELFPDVIGGLRLNIPRLAKVPDALTEALFEVDCFRRLQTPDGGVSYGIETNGDPFEGEVSWLQSMPAFVYAPDPWSSWEYAAVAARAARLLEQCDRKLARVYRDSAARAMEWAERDFAARRAAGAEKKLPWEARDARNLAALALYALTEEPRWREVFLETTVLTDPKAPIFAWGRHVQRDAAFFYARLPDRLTDPDLRKNAVAAVEQQAKAALAYARGNAFNLTTPDKGKPMFIGFFSTPDAIELCRAHFLTGKREYLAGAVQACLFSAGANPLNMTYTVGLGQNWPKNPLHLDSRRSGQPAPIGLTVYGNLDYVRWNDEGNLWPMKWYLDQACTPSAYEWPIAESYFDIFLWPITNEFTVDVWAPNVFVWGYLGARE